MPLIHRPLIKLSFHARLFSSTSQTLKQFCPYKTLSITKTADLATIKKAYYSKVFHLHPDRLASLPGGAPKPRGFRGTVEHVRGLDKSGGTEGVQVDGHDVQHKE
ncbi:hypothetical protein BCR33DRAFT_93345 [Rhizoclosmatium globosum]|uniref:J domain-containing protein n=1 Tax=Rhizoclosmatium globosum TaxID=329046 RepID=A0A1Y2CJR3_9FUNG|nr:hypothetical protein BCR33DRAFT_93345 [Rhizoclosmatium globosum]|eukprot:ORY47271.1 hypothetical protein BCR33DRAFT_93345 [Rhizoclosmatium globosum]